METLNKKENAQLYYRPQNAFLEKEFRQGLH
jgi:hypothetical protein